MICWWSSLTIFLCCANLNCVKCQRTVENRSRMHALLGTDITTVPIKSRYTRYVMLTFSLLFPSHASQPFLSIPEVVHDQAQAPPPFSNPTKYAKYSDIYCTNTKTRSHHSSCTQPRSNSRIGTWCEWWWKKKYDSLSQTLSLSDYCS